MPPSLQNSLSSERRMWSGEGIIPGRSVAEAGPIFLEYYRGPEFSILCWQKVKDQVFHLQLLTRPRRAPGASLCLQMLARVGDKNIGRKNLPAKPAASHCDLVLLAQGVLNPTRIFESIWTFNHFQDSQCSHQKVRRKTIVTSFIPLPHARIFWKRNIISTAV